jgi:hypothetical protein
LIEAKFSEAVVAEAECRADRFLAHIQPYEFEALLFSDVSRFTEFRAEWKSFQPLLESARASVTSPEHINEGPETHPSARLSKLVPRYEKVLHGPAIIARIGLSRVRVECAHFARWLTRLEALQPLRAET